MNLEELKQKAIRDYENARNAALAQRKMLGEGAVTHYINYCLQPKYEAKLLGLQELENELKEVV